LGLKLQIDFRKDFHMRTTIVFFAGVIASILVAAAAFRGGSPVDYTFTYQGQLRNAGALVNGPVDLRITLWDSDIAGGQVGPINNYQAVPITEGRFALGLNFGATAFDGSNRWVQLEFRSPAGSGQYLTLNPRDKIMATPYAMFALNGGNGIWNYNAENQSVSVLGQKVGIGTSNPTAALEVVSATGGDDSVKLPAGSVGKQELAVSLPAALYMAVGMGGGAGTVFTRTVTIPQDGYVLVRAEASVGCPYFHWDGADVPLQVFAVTAGQHTMTMARQCYDGANTTMFITILFFNNTLTP
jgi:hypothetical protein